MITNTSQTKFFMPFLYIYSVTSLLLHLNLFSISSIKNVKTVQQVHQTFHQNIWYYYFTSLVHFSRTIPQLHILKTIECHVKYLFTIYILTLLIVENIRSPVHKLLEIFQFCLHILLATSHLVVYHTSLLYLL